VAVEEELWCALLGPVMHSLPGMQISRPREDCKVGYNDLDFFLNGERHPVMGEKLNSKTHLQIGFRFFEPFHARLALKFAKGANMI
jgi:hypothetical protein